MSDFDAIFRPAADEILRLRGSVQKFKPDGAAARDVTVAVGTESTKYEDKCGGQEVMRVVTVEYSVAQIPDVTVLKDTFILDGETWTVSTKDTGNSLGVAVVERPERAQKAGRNRM